MKKIAIPLVLLASISTLTSCANKTTETSTTVTPAPQAVVETTPVAPTPDATTPPTVPPVEVPPVPTTQATPTTKTETVSYTNPSGSDEVEFSLTVTDGVITAASATPKAKNEISTKLQTAFAAEIGTKVVGMKISDLNLAAVGGASLTTGAFNKFLQTF